MNTFYKILMTAVIVFILLKVAEVITISWWWLMVPLGIMLLGLVIIMLIVEYVLEDKPDEPDFI